MEQTGRPRLRGQAHELLFKHLRAADKKDPASTHPNTNKAITNPQQLFKYMLICKNNMLVVRRYLHGCILYRTHYGFCIELKTKSGTVRYAKMSLQVVLAWMALAKVQLISVMINSSFDLDPMRALASNLSGRVLLSAFADPKLIPIVKTLKDQIIQMDCSMDTLKLNKLPCLKLNILKLRPLKQEQKLKVSRILRHDVRELEATFRDPFPLQRSRMKKRFSNKKSLEVLRLNLCDVDLMEDLLPFLQQLRQLAPKLETLELTIEATTEMLFGTMFDNKLLSFYTTIERFGNQTSEFLKKLTINFNGHITLSGEDLIKAATSIWMQQLKTSPKFQDAKFTLKSIDKQTLHGVESFLFIKRNENEEEDENIVLIEEISLQKSDGFLCLNFFVKFEYFLDELGGTQLDGPLIYAFPEF
ncbi:hypothetical protein M3Y97_00664100 [Aphelenchoides bicaudatus]|nr:hypothetical protein M3Y97_00664100 [Aphelenchoides bicaudatus]